MRLFVVNGVERCVVVNDGERLDVLLRKGLGLKSVLRGCESGACGACRVIVDGALTTACTLHEGELLDGAAIETAEAVQANERMRTVLRAFVAERDTRCALCLGGLAMTAVHLERRGCAHDAPAVDEVLAGANCACTGRGSLRRALLAP